MMSMETAMQTASSSPDVFMRSLNGVSVRFALLAGVTNSVVD